MSTPKVDELGKRLVIVYSEEEFKKLKKLFARSVYKTVSRYVRQVSLEQPVEIQVRNCSFDDFIDEIARFRKEMTLIRDMPLTLNNELKIISLQEQIKTRTDKIIDLCMLQ